MRGILVAGLVIAVTAFAGCADEPKPRFEESTETPSASDSTTSATAEPEPWEEKSKAGAKAFAGHWIATFNQAIVSGDTSSLESLSSPSCRTCNSVIERLKSIYSSGGFFEGDGYQVLYATPEEIRSDGQTSVAMRVQRSAERFKESKGAPLQRNPASKASYNAQLSWRNDAWRMDELVVFN